LEVLGALESGGIVAPEPVKQDLIDNEILESVPKTMKAKVQLLLKKMKSSPNISWNKKHGSSTRFDWSQGPLEIHHSVVVNSIDYNASPGKSSSSWLMQSARVLRL
jgi:hypothetical protein